jgi:hypothetical protein
MRLILSLIATLSVLTLIVSTVVYSKNMPADDASAATGKEQPATENSGSALPAEQPEPVEQTSAQEPEAAAENLLTDSAESVAVTIAFPPAVNSEAALGINTNEVFEQDASIPFVDLFRVATPFHENIRCREQDLTSAQVEYDTQGWPKKLNDGRAGAFFLRNVPLAALPEGDYSVLYDGEGRIDYLHNIEVIARQPGEDTIRFNARKDGFMTAALQIVASDPEQPLRNIRILMPGGICRDAPFKQVAGAQACEDTEYLDFKTHYAAIIFNPDYLNFMKDFGVIRFMPMSGITRNPAQHWEQRPKMDEATWGGNYGARGVPPEIQVELANRLKANPWLNVPHAADDDYMRRFAEYVHEHLLPELTPYIEYTNEAWNANFVHNEYMQKMGIAQQLDKDALMAGYKYYAKRSVEFFKIWEAVYGGHERFVRLIGGWDTRPDISGILLAYNDTYKSVDALAIAPYIGGNLVGFRNAEDVDDIFHLLTDEKSYRSLPKVIEEIKKQAELAEKFGVSLIAYEGGQGLVDWAAKDYEQHPNPLFFAANRDPRMGELYLDLYSQWQDLGAELFVAFSAPRSCNWHGCWGLKEHIRQDTDKAPKLAASLQFMAEHPRWWTWPEHREKPEPAAVADYLPEPDNNEPRIVIRPAKGDKEHFHRLENPQALNILLEGDTWDKRDISGKWQVKWDDDNLYFVAKVYDKETGNDSDDPLNDDSVEFFIDADGSRKDKFDDKNDYHFIFARDKKQLKLGKKNPSDHELDVAYEVEEKYDGYELRATIRWEDLGMSPAVKDRLGMDVIINDDDDGGDRDARIGWNTRTSQITPRDFGMILVSGR